MGKEYLTLREIQLAELEMLKAFDAFCRKHDIQYTVFGGTLLGAVRHGGFIPWDDDIDLAVPRPDYEKFLRLVYDDGELISDNIIVRSGDREKTFAMPYTKLFRVDIAVDEGKRLYKSDGDSIWLDIFPLDGLPSNVDRLKTEWNEVAKLRRNLARSISVIGRKRPNESIARLFIRIPLALYSRIKGFGYYKEKMIRLARSCDYADSSIVGNIVFGVDDFRLELLDKNEVNESKELLFEGYSVLALNDPEQFLSRRYGDWRIVPPKEKQSSHYVKAYWK